MNGPRFLQLSQRVWAVGFWKGGTEARRPPSQPQKTTSSEAERRTGVAPPFLFLAFLKIATQLASEPFEEEHEPRKNGKSAHDFGSSFLVYPPIDQ